MKTEPGQVFDAYSSNYDEALQHGVSLSGEDKEYFALHRIQWLRRVLPRPPDGCRVLDFGCGTGTSGPYLLDHLGAREVVGVDVSASSIDMARKLHRRPGLRFTTQEQLDPAERFDLVFCNGVFHHIPLAARLEITILAVLTTFGGTITHTEKAAPRGYPAADYTQDPDTLSA